MFIDNKYTKWYYTIISTAKSRILDADSYKEKHHIVPKSFGGNNSESNLVYLTAREHFICHLLLIKMTTAEHRRKMVFAAWRLSHPKNLEHGLKINSRTYAILKLQVSIAHKNMWADPEYKEKLLQKRKQTMQSESYKNIQSRISKNRWCDPEYRERMKLLHKERCSDPEYRKKQSEIQKQIHINNPELGKKKARPGKLNGMFGKTHSPKVKEKLALGPKISLKGKSYEEIHGVEKAETLKQDRSLKLKEYLKLNPELRKGSNNSNAKSYEFISPDNTVYQIYGELRKFCKEHQLELTATINLLKERRTEYKGWRARYL